MALEDRQHFAVVRRAAAPDSLEALLILKLEILQDRRMEI
jgi:hypothetical protein